MLQIIDDIIRDVYIKKIEHNEIWNDKNLVLKLIDQISPVCLEYASDEIKNDKEFFIIKRQF